MLWGAVGFCEVLWDAVRCCERDAVRCCEVLSCGVEEQLQLSAQGLDKTDLVNTQS